MKIIFDDGTIFWIDEKQKYTDIDDSAVIVDFWSRTIQILDNPKADLKIQYQLNFPNTVVDDSNRWKDSRIEWYESK